MGWTVFIAVIVAVLIIVTLAPLLIFVDEAAHNPDLIRVRYEAKQVNETAINLTIIVSYNGSIPLNNLTLILGNQEVDIGNLQPHSSVSKSLIIAANRVRNLSSLGMSFSIMDLYALKVSRK